MYIILLTLKLSFENMIVSQLT